MCACVYIWIFCTIKRNPKFLSFLPTFYKFSHKTYVMEMGNNTNVDMGNYGDREPDIEWINNLAWCGKAVRSDGFTCEVHPGQSSSYGIWEKALFNKVHLHIWQYPLPNLELVILLVFVLWQVFDILFKKLGLLIPKFASMMLVSTF